jgi:hypothetical protein
MSTIIRLIFAIAALVALAPVAWGQARATPVEIAQLPRFCWAQYVPDATGDDFRIRDCGPGANHYCPGLVAMIRARSQANKSAKLGLLGNADAEVRYTEKAIADYPKCSIREHVADTRAAVNNLLTMYGSKHRAQ